MMQLTPDEIAKVVLARHRRGVWVGLLTVLTWGLWLAAAGWTAYVALNYESKVFRGRDLSGVRVVLPDAKPAPPGTMGTLDPQEVLIPDGSRIGRYTAEQTRPMTAEERTRYGLQRGADQIGGLTWAVYSVLGILAVLLLALLSTLTLLGAVRRATLRQIQASLAAIAGQLAAVQRGPGTMPPTAGG